MKKILITPLDWGLGHATRCIPVIREFLARGCDVQLAGSGDALKLLQSEFPALKSYSLSAYNPIYPKNGSMVFTMAMQLPKFISIIRKEHREVEALITEQNFDMVISDNRYGCWSSQIPSVFITHQSNILMPDRFGWLSAGVRSMNERMLKKFSRCWIPDYPEENSLAGELIAFGKYNQQLKVDYIGALSRMKPCVEHDKKYEVMAICSGPEPQRSLFEALLKKQLINSDLKFVLVRGVIENSYQAEKTGHGEVVNFLKSEQLQCLVCQSEYIVARSGYSTLMDMKALGKKLICVPTPGQTEQEYLARRLEEKGIAFFMTQKNFDLKIALDESRRYSGFVLKNDSHEALSKAIDKILY